MPGLPSSSHPKVFVSYSHDHEEHEERILGLAERLRKDGFETMIDQYVEGTPLQGWPRWMLNQLDWADHVLLICTEIYYRRFRGLGSHAVGKGVDWEGAIITNEMYDQKSVSRRFVPILLDESDAQYIPEPLRSFARYVVTTREGYKKLTDFLAGAAGVEPGYLGPPPDRKRKRGTPLRLDDGRGRRSAQGTKGHAPTQMSGLPAPGGTMSADDRFYIERGADRSAKEAAELPADTIVVKGPHQFGKSSLLAHYVALCSINGKGVVSVNFSRFEKSILCDYSRFLTALAGEIASRLRSSGPAGELRTQQEFLHFIESALFPAINEPIVFAFAETDRLMPQDYAQDFFSMVRMWHNERAFRRLPWLKVGLALTSSSEPKLYIKDARRSPFNVGRELQLDVFTVGEVAELNRRYGSPLSPADCTRLHQLVGGHPYLTQNAYYKLIGPDSISFERLCAEAARDDGPFGAHLRAMHSNIVAVDGLADALKQALDEGTIPRNSDVYYRLAGAGLVRRDDGGRIILRNQIYAGFFRNVL